MKTYFTNVFGMIFLSAFLFSCGSSLTVTKRHYKKGYYVSYSRTPGSSDSGTDEKSIKQSDSKTRIAEIKNSELVNEEHENNVIEEKVSNEEANSTTDFIRDPIDFEQREITSYVKDNSKIDDERSEEIDQNPLPRHEDGLSWVWIIILIILILWALGYGFGFGGLGGLIHLLLVVALILLILWLLGVI